MYTGYTKTMHQCFTCFDHGAQAVVFRRRSWLLSVPSSRATGQLPSEQGAGSEVLAGQNSDRSDHKGMDKRLSYYPSQVFRTHQSPSTVEDRCPR